MGAASSATAERAVDGNRATCPTVVDLPATEPSRLQDRFKNLIPHFYSAKPPDPEEYRQAEFIWDLICTGDTTELGLFTSRKLATFFYAVFRRKIRNTRGCETIVDAMTQPALMKTIDLFFVFGRSHTALHDNLVCEVAELNYLKGMRACDYGLFGQIVFWAMEYILGETLFTRSVLGAWQSIFSAFLRAVLPLALEFETSRYFSDVLTSGPSPADVYTSSDDDALPNYIMLPVGTERVLAQYNTISQASVSVGVAGVSTARPVNSSLGSDWNRILGSSSSDSSDSLFPFTESEFTGSAMRAVSLDKKDDLFGDSWDCF